MQRASYVITVNSDLAEGVTFTRPEGVGSGGSVLTLTLGGSRTERMRQALEQLLEQVEWSVGPVTLVLPTEDITFRRLEYPFREMKKIRQTLPFELENELLDPPEAYASDFRVVAQPDGSAVVPVYLVRHDLLDGLVQACEARGLGVQKVTFSALALADARSVPNGRQVQVYLGPGEGFVSLLMDGRIEVVENLMARPDRLVEELKAAGLSTPQKMYAALGKALGEEATPPEEPRLRNLSELRTAAEEINRFLRVHGLTQPLTLTVHGLFAPLFKVLPDGPSVTVRGEVPTRRSGGNHTYFGLLAELEQHPGALLISRGLNFYRAVNPWLAQVKDLRWPLITGGTLVIILLALLGWDFYSRTAHQQERLTALNHQIEAVLKVPMPENVAVTTNALNQLREQVERLKKEQQSVARFSNYHYDVLELLKNVSGVLAGFPQVTVEGITLNTERFTMTGTTDSYNDSEAIKDRLAALPRFQGKTAQVTHSRVGQVIRYRLTIER